MTTLRTIAVTTVVAVAGTMAAFAGLHVGQSPAGAATAAQPAKAKASYTVTLTAQDLARLAGLMNGGQTKSPALTTAHHKSRTHHARVATRRATHHARRHGGHRVADHAYATSGATRHSASRGGWSCYDGRHSGGSSHHGGGCD